MERATARNPKKANVILEYLFEAADKIGLFIQVFLCYSLLVTLLPLAAIVDLILYAKDRQGPFCCLFLTCRKDEYLYREEESEY